MFDYEEMILECQESEEDECKNCPYKKEKCKNQCMKIQTIYNPVLGGKQNV